jgi:polyphosphate kinase 2 (PPK2 family)
VRKAAARRSLWGGQRRLSCPPKQVCLDPFRVSALPRIGNLRVVFDTASIAHDVDKATWKRKEPPLRQALLATQYAVLEKKAFPVLVLIGGVEGAGKGETVNLLHEWMDPRHLITHAFDAPSEDARLTVLSTRCAAIERRFDER